MAAGDEQVVMVAVELLTKIWWPWPLMVKYASVLPSMSTKLFGG